MLYYNPPLSDKEMVEKSARRVGLQLPDLSGIPSSSTSTNDEDDAAVSADLSSANAAPASEPADPKR